MIPLFVAVVALALVVGALTTLKLTPKTIVVPEFTLRRIDAGAERIAAVLPIKPPAFPATRSRPPVRVGQLFVMNRIAMNSCGLRSAWCRSHVRDQFRVASVTLCRVDGVSDETLKWFGLDPTCMCGEPLENHTGYEGHMYVSMGQEEDFLKEYLSSKWRGNLHNDSLVYILELKKAV